MTQILRYIYAISQFGIKIISTLESIIQTSSAIDVSTYIQDLKINYARTE